jgi:hypothetical protein
MFILLSCAHFLALTDFLSGGVSFLCAKTGHSFEPSVVIKNAWNFIRIAFTRLYLVVRVW